MNYAKALSAVLITLILVALTACGGGGSISSSGANTVSGVAATGAPIMGTVTMKDKNGLQRGPVATDTNGNFSVDVTGLKAPFILKIVESTGNPPTTLFSVATAAGTANINPLTHLALQLAANSDPAAVFGGQGANPDTSQINGATISAAQDRIKTLLAPLLAKYGITDFDPINGSYTATPDNKLDTMLDVIAVKLNNGTLSITNKLAGTTIASGNIANIAAMTLAMANTPDSARLTDIKEITQWLATLRAIINLGAALTVNATEGLFIPDPNYGTSSGHTRTQDMTSIVTFFGAGGTNKNGSLKSLQNLRLVSDQSDNYPGRGAAKVYLLNYDFIYENGTVVHGNNVTLAKEASSGVWKFIGDPSFETEYHGMTRILAATFGNNMLTPYIPIGNYYGGSNTVSGMISNNKITATIPIGNNTGAITATTGSNTITARTGN